MKKIALAENVYWVGAVDWISRDFHGYSINGTTYNAFLIIDEKITLIDTVKKPYKSELLHRIRNIIDPEKIDYLVVNHVEMDHSGCLPEIVEAIRPEKIICSKMGHKALLQHFHQADWPYHVVSGGEEISLGKRTLSFLETRMLHWPDSMFTYLKEDQILFTSDAFGEHLATSERFDDEVEQGVLMHEATKYYANILNLYSPLVKKLLAKVEEMQLPIRMLAPDHGVVWRSNPGRIIEAYGRWCNQQGNGKALVIYDTMWESTRTMAKAVCEGLHDVGVEYKLIDLRARFADPEQRYAAAHGRLPHVHARAQAGQHGGRVVRFLRLVGRGGEDDERDHQGTGRGPLPPGGQGPVRAGARAARPVRGTWPDRGPGGAGPDGRREGGIGGVIA